MKNLETPVKTGRVGRYDNLTGNYLVFKSHYRSNTLQVVNNSNKNSVISCKNIGLVWLQYEQ